MKEVTINSYGKINLSIDITGKREDGYHRVEMIMHQIMLHDDVTLCWKSSGIPGPVNDQNKKAGCGIKINVSSDKKYVPAGEDNIAFKAAALMAKHHGRGLLGEVDIFIKKRIPVAAGLAGGSGNAAAVLHGLNVLWGLSLGTKELCILGESLGADVPFAVLGQARCSPAVDEKTRKDPMASSCAFAYGRGTLLRPVTPLKSFVVISKPPISISTGEVYSGMDKREIEVHPATKELISALDEGNHKKVAVNMINVLEIYTLSMYDEVVYTKNKMLELCKDEPVMMSGSGPTVYALIQQKNKAKDVYNKMKEYNRETFLTETTL
ncbi:MAG TPA: 4-(cytidine 5'-diphospho)-2-C-methyl-D-erythritol kinase [Bacillota bacterium]|nr:4-(cytidine 5'-diphospho)-2-C-methyl-D-erythritol kinase [Bacillota bacterium]